jgi:hypothetical protein
VIEVKLTAAFAKNAGNKLELKIKAPPSANPQEIPVEQIPTFIYIHDSLTATQLPIVTHALTDTANRITWANQIQVGIGAHQLPNHLEAIQIGNQNVFAHARSLGPCHLILISNEENKDLKREISQSSEFLTKTHVVKPTDAIQTIDALNDHIKNLKQKTIVNLKVEIELPNDTDTLEPLEYIPQINKVGNTYFANLIDLASEEEKVYAFETQQHKLGLKYEYEDLLLTRQISGGQRIQSN